MMGSCLHILFQDLFVGSETNTIVINIRIRTKAETCTVIRLYTIGYSPGSNQNAIT